MSNSLRTIFPHCLSHEDIAYYGPSNWITCSRPSCRLVYRTTAFVRVVPPPCPMCGQPVIPAAHGPALTPAQRAAVVVPFFATEVAPTGDQIDPSGRHGGAR